MATRTKIEEATVRRPIFSVLLGIVLAAAAMYLLYTWKAGDTAVAVASPAPTEKVLVAARDIPFGTRLKPELLKEVSWPEDSVPSDAITNRDALLKGPQGARLAVRSFAAGEPFLKSKVSGFGDKPTLSRKVADDMRAFSIRINDVSGVAGFLLPGDRVDVLLTRPAGDDKDNLVTDVILQSVVVLGVDQLASEESEKPVVARTATVEVTPEQAQKLALAQQLGTLGLTLRNHADMDQADVRRISVADLGAVRRAPAARAPVDPAIYVRVRKGSGLTSERVPR
jgi:pilus assembly protein CpaB